MVYDTLFSKDDRWLHDISVREWSVEFQMYLEASHQFSVDKRMKPSQ
jgi:hypothetical protein